MRTLALTERDVAGTPDIEQTLRKLNVLGSALMIAAHPDDENTAVLAWLALGRHMRTAYLSLTRGEGGQNLIGPEQGAHLGIIRTQELLAARRVDGAQQFFTRAIDFGYSKTTAQTFAKWDHDTILGDVVWVIRRFCPDVILMRFSGTSSDGHGHHQVSAILAREAFEAAADPRRFPGQLPWQAKRLVWNVFSLTREQERAVKFMSSCVQVDTADLCEMLGKSYSEIGAISRGMHRSQGMGSLAGTGPAQNFFLHVAGEPARRDLFDYIDTSWSRVNGGAEIGRLIERAIAKWNLGQPRDAVRDLLAARKLMNEIRDPVARGKLGDLDEAIAQCAGLWVGAEADRPVSIPGDTVKIKLTAIDRFGFGMGSVHATVMYASRGLTTTLSPDRNQSAEATVSQAIAVDQPASQPIWLQEHGQGGMYTANRRELFDAPDLPPLVRVWFQVGIGDTQIELERSVRYGYERAGERELTRPLMVVPPVAVNTPRVALMFPDTQPRNIQLQVLGNTAASGRLRIDLSGGCSAQPAWQPFRLRNAGDQQECTYEIWPPAQETSCQLRAVAEIGGRTISRGMEVICYPHIPVQTVFPPSERNLVRADIKITTKNVGYIMGVGDGLPDAIRQLGASISLLAAADLGQGDLSPFDAIVTGVRAYNAHAGLRTNHHRLLDYVNSGGTLIVQYNVNYGPLLPQLGPYPITISHRRVSVADAPVTLPNPQHALLHEPNQITLRDFEPGCKSAVSISPRLGIRVTSRCSNHTIRTSRRSWAACSIRDMARAFTSSARTPGSANSPRVSSEPTASSRIC